MAPRTKPPTKSPGSTSIPSAPAAKNAKPSNEPRDESSARRTAELSMSSTVQNGATAHSFAKASFTPLALDACIKILRENASRVTSGDTSGLEITLASQATALDTIFNELARRASTNMGQYLNATETYLRLAFKAQAQCRATLQTLAEIKLPRPVAFVKQANIAHGPQQVNNGPGASADQPHARAGISADRSNELLETSDVKRLDAGAASAPGSAHPQLEAVGAINRAPD